MLASLTRKLFREFAISMMLTTFANLHSDSVSSRLCHITSNVAFDVGDAATSDEFAVIDSVRSPLQRNLDAKALMLRIKPVASPLHK
ncbi:hypothetical protein Tco_1431429, partial [Tanacetum coccineum]